MNDEERRTAADRERTRRHTICRDAFLADRFVLFLNLCHSPAAVCFVPTYDEAPGFLKRYVAPFLLDYGGTLERGSWMSPLPSEMQSDERPVYWRQFIRWRDINSVEIWTETDEQRARLDEILPDAIDGFLLDRQELLKRRRDMGIGE